MATAPALAVGRFDGFGVAESDRGRFVARGVAWGTGVGFGFGVTFGVGVGLGVGFGVGLGVGVACGCEGRGLSDGLANGVTLVAPPSDCCVAKAGAQRMAVTRKATATDADLARARIDMV